MVPMNLCLRLLLPLLLVLASAAWAEGRGSGGGSSGGGSGSSGRSRALSLPSSSGINGTTGRTSSSERGSGKEASRLEDAAKDAAKDAARDATKDATKDGGKDSSRSGRDDSNTRDGSARRDSDDRSGSTPRPAGSEIPEARWQAMDRLVRSNPLVYERDPIGAPVLRAEITMLLPADAELPATLARRGFIAVRENTVLGRRLVVLRTPADLTLARAVELGRRLMPEAEIDFNHVLLGSGQAEPARRASAATAPPAPSPLPEPVQVGLIDEALPPGDEPSVLGQVRTVGPRCLPKAAPQGHGQAVATVLARSLQQAGRRPVLHAADLGCGQGAVDAIATALQALDAERVPVVNVSAVAPYNRVMAAVVAAFLARGHLLVAAVGNDGPAAPPLYPAAYPGVIAVTAVDRQGRVLVEAGRGEHVAFAALGVVELPGPDGSLRTWRGTSLAAPVVAAALAVRLPQPDPAAARAAVAELARQSQDAGEPGRDRVFGYGIVGLP